MSIKSGDIVRRTATRQGRQFAGIIQWRKGYTFKVREHLGSTVIEDSEKNRIHSVCQLEKVK